jgi:hypothetical protein
LKKVLTTSLLIIYSFVFWAQTETNPPKDKEINRDFLAQKNDSSSMRNPKKAALYAAAFPGLGLGQIYNHKYWKLPIVYAGTAFFTYKIISSNSNYIQYRNELYRRDIQATFPNLKYSYADPELTSFSDASIRTRKDLYRKQRDRMILFSGVFYGVTILDAIVDAHLDGFDTNKKHLVSFRPTVLPTYSSATLGLDFSLRF